MQGLSKDSSWENICKVIGIASYEDYVAHFNECLLVQQLYHIIWQHNTIYYLKTSTATAGLYDDMIDIHQQLIQLQHSLMLYAQKSNDFEKFLRILTIIFMHHMRRQLNDLTMQKLPSTSWSLNNRKLC